MKNFSCRIVRSAVIVVCITLCNACVVANLPENTAEHEFTKPKWHDNWLNSVLLNCNTSPFDEQIIEHCQRTLAKLMIETPAFNTYGFNPYRFKDPEHKLTILFSTDEFNTSKSLLAALTGTTLGLIPSMDKETISLQLILEDDTGTLLAEYENTGSVETWYNIIGLLAVTKNVKQNLLSAMLISGMNDIFDQLERLEDKQ